MQETTKQQESTELTLHQPPICPYLGLRNDATVVTGYATERHACYNREQPSTPTSAHQWNYCLGHLYHECSHYSLPTPEEVQKATPAAVRRQMGFFKQVFGVLILVFVVVASTKWVSHTFQIGMIDDSARQVKVAASQPVPTPGFPTATLLEVLLPTVTSTPPRSTEANGASNHTSNTTSNIVLMATDRFATPTPAVGGQVVYITPQTNHVAWWLSGDTSSQQLGDSFLYAGLYNDQSYVSAAQFDLSQSFGERRSSRQPCG